MSKATPTPSQTRMLELLSAFEYLTTQEVCEYLAGSVTKRAVEQRLQLLMQHGFIQADLLYPERGKASPRRWLLLKKGCDALGVPYEPPAVGEERGVVSRGAPVLRLLAEMQHLTTKQIRSHLHQDKPEWYTWQLLNSLKEQGYIRGVRLYPERGAASECYWTIRRRGATAIGAPHDRRYLRHPARRTIEYRGLLLEMSRHVEGAGWSLLKPLTYRPGRRAALESLGELPTEGRHSVLNAEPGGGRHSTVPGDTLQRQHLVEAVLYREAIAIEKLVREGYTMAGLQDRMERLKARQVGALVPRIVNDYVAYVRGEPGQTAVLIPQPPWAGRSFWSRRPGHRKLNTGRQDRPQDRSQDSSRARLERYARLARVVPVLGVFATQEAADQYGGLLAAAGLQWTLVEDVGDKLLKITGPQDHRTTEPQNHRTTGPQDHRISSR